MSEKTTPPAPLSAGYGHCSLNNTVYTVQKRKREEPAREVTASLPSGETTLLSAGCYVRNTKYRE